MSDNPVGEPSDLPQSAVDGHAAAPAGSSSQTEPPQEQQTQVTSPNKCKGKKKKKKKILWDRKPLHAEPLSTHPREVKLAAYRAAIAAGADVNGLDESHPVCHREGRPLDACLRVTHMAHGATFYSNVDLIELLLEHGADPRLRDLKNVFFTPLEVATFNAAKEGQSPRAKSFYERVVEMFTEAIAKLEEKEKRASGEGNSGKGVEQNEVSGEKSKTEEGSPGERVEQSDVAGEKGEKGEN